MLLDSGADISMIKISQLQGNTPCYEDHKLTIKGLTSETFSTLGYCYLEILIDPFLTYEAIFHVVKDDFPIEFDGILGNDTLSSLKLQVDYNSDLLKFERGSIPLLYLRKSLISYSNTDTTETQVYNRPEEQNHEHKSLSSPNIENLSTLNIPARSESLIPIRIINSHVKEGIVNRQNYKTDCTCVRAL
jgi:Retroviral aspartyl protease.